MMDDGRGKLCPLENEVRVGRVPDMPHWVDRLFFLRKKAFPGIRVILLTEDGITGVILSSINANFVQYAAMIAAYFCFTGIRRTAEPEAGGERERAAAAAAAVDWNRGGWWR